MATHQPSQPLPTELLALLDAVATHSNSHKVTEQCSALRYLTHAESLPRLNGLALRILDEPSTAVSSF